MPYKLHGEYVTAKEGAELIGCGHSTVRAACTNGEIRDAVLIDGRTRSGVWLIPLPSLHDWNERRRPRGRPVARERSQEG